MTDSERFEAGAQAYADYLQTTEGRLRLELAWANLRAQLSAPAPGPHTRRALDLGGGPGTIAVRLARAGWACALVDSSAAMLTHAQAAAHAADVAAHLSLQQADAAAARTLFAPGTFALAVCHNVLEYVPDPAAVVQTLAALLSPGGLVSVLVRNRAGEAMRAAVKQHDFAAAEHALAAATVTESLYGGPARVFTPADLRALLAETEFEFVAERGVRVVADYLPPALTATPEKFARLCAFERTLGARPEFAAVARYTQVFARRR